MVKAYNKTNTSVRVSYILPTQNRAKFLEKSLLNIREFKTDRDELIIIDGDSKDGTKELINKNKDLVDFFLSEKSLGEAHKLNKAILLSKGKFIKTLTDDDYIYPEAMKKAIDVMEKNPEIEALQCGGESYVYNEKTNTEKIRFYEQIFPGVKIAKNIVHIMTHCPCGLGLVLRKDVISKAGLFDTNFRAADLSYISQLIKSKTNFKYLNISLYKHFKYEHSGENYVDEVHKDEAKVFFDHHLWEKLMSVETKVLLPVLGLDNLERGEELLRSIKLLDFLRRKKIIFPIQILNFLSKQRKTLKKIKALFASEPVNLNNQQPVPPLRDNKFW